MHASNKKVFKYIVHMLRKLKVEIKGSHLWWCPSVCLSVINRTWRFLKPQRTPSGNWIDLTVVENPSPKDSEKCVCCATHGTFQSAMG